MHLCTLSYYWAIWYGEGTSKNASLCDGDFASVQSIYTIIISVCCPNNMKVEAVLQSTSDIFQNHGGNINPMYLTSVILCAALCLC